ncbi:MAG: diphthine--ammonia ligase [Trueperaceae bacterium]
MSLAFASWSGGKDSALALYRAKQQGLKVTTLLTMLEETKERSRSHAVPLHVMKAQADAMGLKLIAPSASWSDYEAVFIDTLKTLKGQGFTIGVFGDIDLQAHQDWEEKVCAVAGIKAHLPLWLEPRKKLAKEVLELGFRAVVVCVNDRYLNKSFCGCEYNEVFLQDLPKSVDACGENGEFHTFVYDGPVFQKAVHVYVAQHTTYHAPENLGGDTYYFAGLELSKNSTKGGL